MTLARDRLAAAWTGVAGVDVARSGLHVVEREGIDAVVVIEFGPGVAVLCPPSIHRDIAGIDMDEARSVVRLAERIAAPGVRVIGTAELWASVVAPRRQGGYEVGGVDAGDLRMLRSQCSVEEWEECGLEGMAPVWIARDRSGVPVAAAGYEKWAETVAQVGVLTDPGMRGRGFAAAVVAAAVGDALAYLEVAQWRSRVGNTASRRLAERLGFELVGRQSAIALARA